MLGRILQQVQHWRYLGYDRETVERYRAQTDYTNLHTIKRMCLLAIAMIIFLCFFFIQILLRAEQVILILTFTVFLIALYFSSDKRLRNNTSGPVRGVKLLIYAASAILYLCGILSGTLLSGGELGVMSVWVFLLVQISFDISPLQNLLTVIPFAGLFLFASRETKTLERWQMDAIYTLVSVSVGVFISYHQAQLALENIIAKSNLQKTNFALYHTATTDELTGLMNRRMVFDRYDAILRECVELQQSVACMVLDIDDYKQFNDSYGHPEGDELLRRMGEILRAFGAEHGVDIGRIGGEEFLTVWPESDVRHCEEIAEELRCAIAQMEIPHSGAPERGLVTISIGLCVLPSTHVQGAYFFADKALYRAKEAGKNCSCRYDVQSDTYLSVCSCNPAVPQKEKD